MPTYRRMAFVQPPWVEAGWLDTPWLYWTFTRAPGCGARSTGIRDEALIELVIAQVRAAAVPGQPMVQRTRTPSAARDHSGGGLVLDRLRVQLLPRACDLGWCASDGRGANRSCLVP